MKIRIYIDESWSDECFALGLFLASEENWKNFSAEWSALLRYGTIDTDGRWHFKMSEMNTPDGHSRLPAFWRIIEDHVIGAASFRFRLADLRSSFSDVQVFNEQVIWEDSDWSDPYFFASRNLLSFLLSNFSRLVPDAGTASVEVIFDENDRKRPVLGIWQELVSKYPEREWILRYEDDKVHLPLQAADLWAWWMRYWTERNLSPEQFGFFKHVAHKKLYGSDVIASRAEIAAFLAGVVAEQLPEALKWKPVFLLSNGDYWKSVD